MKGDITIGGQIIKRVCKDCKLTKRFDCFSVADKSGNRRGVCKSCLKYKDSPDMWMKNHVRKKLYSFNKRCCSKCNKIKCLSLFPNDFVGRVHNNKKSYCLSCAYKMKNDYINRNKDRKAKWDKKHYEKYKDKHNQKFYERLKNNPQYKVAHSLRTNLNGILRRKDQIKVGSVIKSVGCTKQELIKHLENQFYPNPENGEPMTWNNHGTKGWHIDHIRPLCSFDLQNPEDFKMANHYTNLQPLWAKENLSKNGKW